MKRKFAVFDIDGTVYRSSLFLDVVEKLILDGVITKDRAANHYKLKHRWETRAHKESYEEFIWDVVQTTQEGLKDLSVEDVEKASHYIAETNKDLIYTYTRDLISKLKKRGYFILAISGSHSEVAERFCQLHGFDAFSSTIWFRSKNQKTFTGEVLDMGRDKAEQLKTMVEQYELSFEGSYAVGDSKGDITMLHLVENPVAFNPEEKLLLEAKSNSWKVVIERKNVIYELDPKDDKYILA